MRKNLLLCASMLACLTIGLTGCNKGNVADTSKPSGNKPSGNVELVSFEDAYDASVLSGIGLLNSGVSSNTLMNRVSLMAEINDSNEEATEAKPSDGATDTNTPEEKPQNGLDKLDDTLKKEILDNLAIANSTLNGDSAKSEVKKSDRAEWEEMYTITQKDISGNAIVYTFYYTETLGNEEDEEDKDEKLVALADTETNPTETKNEEEEEIEKHIKGVVVAKDMEYEVSGDREIEGNESSVTYKIMLDQDNYVVIENEVEGTENEYEYSKYENGKRVFKSEVEYEINENGEVEIEFETKTPEDGKIKFAYEFVNTNEGSLIKVEIKKEKASVNGEATIKVAVAENGEASYEFIAYEEK